MRKIFLPVLILISSVISSCSTSMPPATPELVTVYSTAAAEPWLHELYNCAGTTAVLSRVDDPSSAQISLHVGEPKTLSVAYQIDTEEILIVAQRQSPVQNLTREEARALFLGQGDSAVQLWVYSSGNDVQDVFDKLVMEGRSVSPSAHLAATPQQMSDTLVNDPNTVGILPRHWKAGDSREVFSVATVPVLAVSPIEPHGTVKDLIACLQSKS